MTVTPKETAIEAVKLRNTTECKLDLLVMRVYCEEQKSGKILCSAKRGNVTRVVEAAYGDYVLLAGGELAVMPDAAFKQMFTVK